MSTLESILTTLCHCTQFEKHTYLGYQQNVVLVISRIRSISPVNPLLAMWSVTTATSARYLTAYLIEDPQMVTANTITKNLNDLTFSYNGVVVDSNYWIDMMEGLIGQSCVVKRVEDSPVEDKIEFNPLELFIRIDDWTPRLNYPVKTSQLMGRSRVIVIRGPGRSGKTTLAKYLLKFQKCNVIRDMMNPGNGESNVIYENRSVNAFQIKQQLAKYPNKIVIITVNEDQQVLRRSHGEQSSIRRGRDEEDNYNDINELLVINLTSKPYLDLPYSRLECNFP